MGKRSTFTGLLRQRGTQNAGSAASSGSPTVVSSYLKLTFDATQASSTGTGFYLPEGARVLSAYSTGEGGGGTVDVGNAGDPDAYASGIAADSVARQETGAELGVAIAAGGVEVTAGDNTGGAGTATVYLEVVYDDDQSLAN